MGDASDILTVACFLLLVFAYFFWTDRKSRTLLDFLICAVSLAVANQLGRAGSPKLAGILIAVGIAYALLVLVKRGRT
jgi:hypothetical protein